MHELYMTDVKEIFNFNCVNSKLSFKCIDNYLRPNFRRHKDKNQSRRRHKKVKDKMIQTCFISKDA